MTPIHSVNIYWVSKSMWDPVLEQMDVVAALKQLTISGRHVNNWWWHPASPEKSQGSTYLHGPSGEDKISHTWWLMETGSERDRRRTSRKPWLPLINGTRSATVSMKAAPNMEIPKCSTHHTSIFSHKQKLKQLHSFHNREKRDIMPTGKRNKDQRMSLSGKLCTLEAERDRLGED